MAYDGPDTNLEEERAAFCSNLGEKMMGSHEVASVNNARHDPPPPAESYCAITPRSHEIALAEGSADPHFGKLCETLETHFGLPDRSLDINAQFGACAAHDSDKVQLISALDFTLPTPGQS